MEQIGETIENVGLAQEIQNGLSKSLQKEPVWPSVEVLAAKRSDLEAAGEAIAYGTRLGKYLMDRWAKTAGVSFPSAKAWSTFVSTPVFELLVKYSALADTSTSQPSSQKQFVETRPLGRGAFGIVFLAFKKDTGMAFATKKIVKGLAKKNNMLRSVKIEQEVLAKVKSRFCVNLHYSYQDDVFCHLVLTLCPGGDLHFLLQQRCIDPETGKQTDYNKLTMPALKFYVASMACGLQAIHDAGYVYRDLKPQNVLLDAEGQLLISDMGLVVDISDGPVTPEKDPLGPSIRHGTCGFWPPEAIREIPYTTSPDWWALGIVAFQLFCDRLPFFATVPAPEDLAEINDKTLRAEEILPTRYTHGEPPELQTFVNSCVCVDVGKRLGCSGGLAEIKKHSFFAGFDWAKLEGGHMAAPFKPNVNDINAPSKKDVENFKKPKDVTWEKEDQAHFDHWEFSDPTLHGDEAICRMRKQKELAFLGDEKPSGGGCCSLQ